MITHRYRLRPDLKLSSESVFLRDTDVQFHGQAAAFSKLLSPTTPSESPVEPPSKKSKKMRQLTAEEEDNMAEWLKDNPCIYNKKLDSYLQTGMTKRLWIEKAKDFPNVDVEYLMSWYKSMRTRFGKLSRLPTGSGAQDLTERDEGIFHKFSWLKTKGQAKWQAARRIDREVVYCCQPFHFWEVIFWGG